MTDKRIRKIINDELRRILAEDSYTGAMTGTQEKEFNSGLRNIHHKYADKYTNITKKTAASKINYGGCGIFAQLLYYNIKKYLGITPDIVALVDKPDINDINSFKSADDIPCFMFHVALRINDYLIDSSGIHKMQSRLSWFDRVYNRKMYAVSGVTISTLNRWCKNSHWNTTFDRYTIRPINDDLIAVMKKVIALKK